MGVPISGARTLDRCPAARIGFRLDEQSEVSRRSLVSQSNFHRCRAELGLFIEPNRLSDHFFPPSSINAESEGQPAKELPSDGCGGRTGAQEKLTRVR